jgi:hypothetical protein
MRHLRTTPPDATMRAVTNPNVRSPIIPRHLTLETSSRCHNERQVTVARRNGPPD